MWLSIFKFLIITNIYMRHFFVFFLFFLTCHAIANIFCIISLMAEDIWNNVLKDIENLWGRISEFFFQMFSFKYWRNKFTAFFFQNKKIAILIFLFFFLSLFFAYNQLKCGKNCNAGRWWWTNNYLWMA